MNSRILQEKAELVSQEILGIAENVYELEYYLIENYTRELDEINGGKEYGIEIVKKSENIVKESKQIQGIYRNREAVEKLLKKMAANTVTPVALEYILDDIIGIDE